jgi:hypothetical protein
MDPIVTTNNLSRTVDVPGHNAIRSCLSGGYSSFVKVCVASLTKNISEKTGDQLHSEVAEFFHGAADFLNGETARSGRKLPNTSLVEEKFDPLASQPDEVEVYDALCFQWQFV